MKRRGSVESTQLFVHLESLKEASDDGAASVVQIHCHQCIIIIDECSQNGAHDIRKLSCFKFPHLFRRECKY